MVWSNQELCSNAIDVTSMTVVLWSQRLKNFCVAIQIVKTDFFFCWKPWLWLQKT